MYELKINGNKLLKCSMRNPIGHSDYTEIAVVPDTVEEIGDRAFDMCALGGIILPDGIKRIGDYAFERSLSEHNKNKYENGDYAGSRENPFMVLVTARINDDNAIVVHPNTRFIDGGAYHAEWYRSYDIRSERIVFGDKLEFIGRFAFEKADIVELKIPASVVRIRECAFSDCKRLISVDLRSKLTELENYLFYRCASIETVALPERLVSICDHVFENCSALAEITIPNGTEKIGKYAFADCAALKTVRGGRGVTSFGDGVFKGCKSLEEFDIPQGTRAIPSEMFCGCESLRRVTIPDGVVSIGANAFSYCKSLGQLHIPASVTAIDGSFDHCDSLKTVTVDDGNEHYFMRDGSLIERATDRPVFVGGGNAHGEVYIAGAGKTVIGFKEYYNNTYLERVRVAPTIKVIESSAFRGCSKLKSIELPDGLEELGHDVFKDCTALEEIVVPATVAEYGFNVFDGCASLKRAIFKGKLSCFPSFKSCVSLTDVVAPSVGYSGYKSFEGCTALKEITLPADLKTVSEGAFSGCTALERIVIPPSVRRIEDNAFAGCTALKEVVIESENITICEHSFAGCISLTELAIGKGVKLGIAALGGSCLKNIDVAPDNELYYVRDGCLLTKDDMLLWLPVGRSELPSGIKGIGGGMYLGSDMESFTVPDGVEVIDEYAFACSKLKEITLPASLKSISLDAFDQCFDIRTVRFKGTICEWHGVDLGEDEYDPSNEDEDYFNLVKGIDYTGQIDVICTDGVD